MTNSDIRYVTVNESTTAIVTPYHPEFVSELKKRVSKPRWNSSQRRWEYPSKENHIVKKLASKFFATRSRKRITWQLDRAETVEIDGMTILDIKTDEWSAGKNVTLVEDDLKSTGNKKYAAVSGTLVVEFEIKDGADIQPKPVSIQEIDEDGNAVANGSEPGEVKTSLQSAQDLLTGLTSEQLAEALEALRKIAGVEQPDPNAEVQAQPQITIKVKKVGNSTKSYQVSIKAGASSIFGGLADDNELEIARKAVAYANEHFDWYRDAQVWLSGAHGRWASTDIDWQKMAKLVEDADEKTDK